MGEGESDPLLEGSVSTSMIWSSLWEIYLYTLIHSFILHLCRCGIIGIYFVLQGTL